MRFKLDVGFPPRGSQEEVGPIKNVTTEDILSIHPFIMDINDAELI